MRRLITLAVLCAALSWPRDAGAQRAPRADHVVLISIDGFRPEFYLDERWPAPTIQQMAREGAHATAMRGIFPTVTFAAHTTLVTGALPARHGIVNNAPFEPGGQTGAWFWDAASIRAPTLWDAVRASGGKAAAVFWPVTRGAAIEWNLPDIGLGENAVVPLAAASTPAGLVGELEREATGRLGRHALQGMAQLDNSGAVGAYLLERYRPRLLLVHLIATDHVQHDHGREGPMVRRAVAGADRAIGRMVEAAQRAGIADRTAFIVTGDHGFVDVQTQVNPNVWLAAAGLMENRPDRGRWRAAFYGKGGSAFLHLDPRRPDPSAVEEVHALLQALPAGERGLFRVVDRAEMDRVGADPGAVLALAAARGVTFGEDAGGPALIAATGGAHGYFPEFADIETGWIGWGAGFRPGAVAPIIGQEDVAPLVAALLGLDFRAPDGVLHPGLLTAANP